MNIYGAGYPADTASYAGGGPTPSPDDQIDEFDDMVSYPFPLESGELVRLWLPRKLSRVDAQRLNKFIESVTSTPNNTEKPS